MNVCINYDINSNININFKMNIKISLNTDINIIANINLLLTYFIGIYTIILEKDLLWERDFQVYL